MVFISFLQSLTNRNNSIILTLILINRFYRNRLQLIIIPVSEQFDFFRTAGVRSQHHTAH